MAHLQWNNSPETVPTPSTSNNPWFVATIGLAGLIAGFGINKLHAGDFPVGIANTPPAQVAQAPSPTPQPPAQPKTADDMPAIDAQKDHIRGDIAKAKVAVVEYSDFECPFCKRHHPTMQQVSDAYKDDVVVVYRHFPLSFHANAQKEAEASECANELGGNDAFWKYTDAIFERTTAGGTGFPLANLAPLAKELGLDDAKFKTCLDSGKFAQHVQDDMSGGSKAGVSGTPGNIVVNLQTKETRLISGAVPFATFKAAIDTMIASKAGAADTSGGARMIKVSVNNWTFSPSTIRASKNEKVTIELTGVAGAHSFAIPDLGIAETVNPGSTVRVSLPTDTSGTFMFRCNIFCGQGHEEMLGEIIIE